MTFNTLIREIDFAAPKSDFLASMQKLLKYIRTANIKFFNNSKIETELRIHISSRDSKEQPVISFCLNLLDDNLEELLTNFRRIKLNSGTYDVQMSISFSRGEDISLSKHAGPQADELDEEEEKSEDNEDPFSEEYRDLNYDIFPNRKNSRVDLLDPETQELLELKQRLLKKIETRKKNMQATLIHTEMTQLTLPKEALNERWQRLRKIMRWVETIRYFLISFRPKKFDKYFMTIVMSILVVLDLVSRSPHTAVPNPFLGIHTLSDRTDEKIAHRSFASIPAKSVFTIPRSFIGNLNQWLFISITNCSSCFSRARTSLEDFS